MRTITDHLINGIASQLIIEVAETEEPSNLYQVSWKALNQDRIPLCRIAFQEGDTLEYGINGLTSAVLLAIVLDRLREKNRVKQSANIQKIIMELSKSLESVKTWIRSS